MYHSRLYLLVVAMFVSSVGASAAVVPLDICRTSSGDEAISACNAVLATRKSTVADRKAAFVSRGVEYEAKGDLDHAIADYNEVIALDPKYAIAFYDRGNAYYHKRD